jgi:hypothetical protein
MMNYSMTKWRNIVGVLRKTFVWFILILLVNLSQVLIAFGFSYIVESEITFEKIITDGVLLFFSVTIVSSLLIDYWQSPEIPAINSRRVLLFGMPALIIVICLILFALVYGRPEEQIIGVDILVGTQLAILVASFVYAVSIKFGIFSVHQQMVDRLSLLNRSSKFIVFVSRFRLNHSSQKGNR